MATKAAAWQTAEPASHHIVCIASGTDRLKHHIDERGTEETARFAGESGEGLRKDFRASTYLSLCRIISL